MEKFEKGKTLRDSFGRPIVIESLIGSGGQGDVYKVTYDGRTMALKWYDPAKINDFDAFYRNLQKNVRKGSPDKAFLWPQAVTEKMDGSFGYIMEIGQDGFYDFTDILFSSTAPKFTSFKAVAEAGIRLVSAFRNLHKHGFSYQDINSGNFMINPKTGQVLICDVDNVAPDGTHTGIIGTPQYMAPEIVLGKSMPNMHTDDFSLAVVLFILLCANHPLEGKHWLTPCLTPAHEKKLYGSEALFIFDPDNDENRPVKGVHNNVIKRWRYMPKYIQDVFIKAFSQEAIKNPCRRVQELEWLKVLTRFQSDIVRCPECRNEIFITDASDTKCDCCGKVYKVRHTLKLYEYSVTAAKNTMVYKCQLGVCNTDEALTTVGRIVTGKDNPDKLGFRNLTGETIIGITPSGKVNKVAPGEVVPLKAGIVIKAFGGEIVIC